MRRLIRSRLIWIPLFANVCPNLPDVRSYPTLPYLLKNEKTTYGIVGMMSETDMFIDYSITVTEERKNEKVVCDITTFC